MLDFYFANGTEPPKHKQISDMVLHQHVSMANFKHGDQFGNGARPVGDTWRESIKMFGKFRVLFIRSASNRVVWTLV